MKFKILTLLLFLKSHPIFAGITKCMNGGDISDGCLSAPDVLQSNQTVSTVFSAANWGIGITFLIMIFTAVGIMGYNFMTSNYMKAGSAILAVASIVVCLGLMTVIL